MKKLIALFVAILIISTGIAWFTSSRNKALKEAVLPKQINVYTTVSKEEMQYIANEFKEQTGITVNYKVVNNLQEAVSQDKGKVDFVYGGNASQLNSMAANGLLEKSNFSFTDDIGNMYKSTDGYWYGTNLEPIVMFYNPNYLLPKDAPQAWVNLTSDFNKGKIVYSPDYEDYMPNILAMISAEHNADNNKITEQQFESGLKVNVPVNSTSNENYIADILKNKQTPISFAPMNEVQALIAQGNTLNIVNPKEGSPLLLEGAAIVKGTSNLNAAKLFMEFVAGPKIQLQLAQKFNVIPVSKNALSFAPTWMKSFNNVYISKNDWNLLNDGQFEAYNKNNPQVMDGNSEKNKKQNDKKQDDKKNKTDNALIKAQQDPLSQPAGSIIDLKPGSPLTQQEKTSQNALNQLQQQPSKVFTE